MIISDQVYACPTILTPDFTTVSRAFVDFNLTKTTFKSFTANALEITRPAIHALAYSAWRTRTRLAGRLEYTLAVLPGESWGAHTGVVPHHIPAFPAIPTRVTHALVDDKLARFAVESVRAHACVVGYQIYACAVMVTWIWLAIVDVHLTLGTTVSRWTDAGVAIVAIDTHATVKTRKRFTFPDVVLTKDAAKTILTGASGMMEK